MCSENDSTFIAPLFPPDQKEIPTKYLQCTDIAFGWPGSMHFACEAFTTPKHYAGNMGMECLVWHWILITSLLSLFRKKKRKCTWAKSKGHVLLRYGCVL